MKKCVFCENVFESETWQCPECGKAPGIQNGYLSFAPNTAKDSAGFNADFFERLSHVEESSFWFRSRNRLILWALNTYFPHAGNFLEIGCGTGYVLSGIRRMFPKLHLSGSDIYHEGFTFAEQRVPGTTFFQMDACRIPFVNEFDVIGAFDVLEHIEKDETVLEQMFQACKPGGGIILTVPQHPFLWSIGDEYSFHKRRYTRDELNRKLVSAGFNIIRQTSFVSLLLPLMAASRLVKRRLKKTFNPAEELTVPTNINTVLEKIMDFERRFITKGFSFCAGGSLLIVARKG